MKEEEDFDRLVVSSDNVMKSKAEFVYRLISGKEGEDVNWARREIVAVANNVFHEGFDDDDVMVVSTSDNTRYLLVFGRVTSSGCGYNRSVYSNVVDVADVIGPRARMMKVTVEMGSGRRSIVVSDVVPSNAPEGTWIAAEAPNEIYSLAHRIVSEYESIEDRFPITVITVVAVGE